MNIIWNIVGSTYVLKEFTQLNFSKEGMLTVIMQINSHASNYRCDNKCYIYRLKMDMGSHIQKTQFQSHFISVKGRDFCEVIIYHVLVFFVPILMSYVFPLRRMKHQVCEGFSLRVIVNCKACLCFHFLPTASK